MAVTTKSTETRALGWYAVQRVRVGDWFRTHGKHKSSPSDGQDGMPDDQSMMLDATGTKEAAKAQEGSEKSKSEKKKSADSKTSADPKVEKQLENVVNESHVVLAKAKSVFPFQLFPDTVSIDRHKLTIIYREFWGVEKTVSVPIENIKNIEADIGPFLGSLTITSDLFINNTQEVKYLTSGDARRIQKLVQGAVVAQREEIDLNKIGTEKLRTLLIDLGSGHTNSVSG
jgi:hypothetical protein